MAGTEDSLLPIDHHARAYARAVAASLAEQPGYPHRPQPAYRLYEVQNGNHIENYKSLFPSLEYILPHAQHAFDLLVNTGRARPDAAAEPVHPESRRHDLVAGPAGALRAALRTLRSRPAPDGRRR